MEVSLGASRMKPSLLLVLASQSRLLPGDGGGLRGALLGEGHGMGSWHVATSAGPLLPDSPNPEHNELVLGVTVADLRAPSALNTSVDIAGAALARAISQEHWHSQGEPPPRPYP